MRLRNQVAAAPGGSVSEISAALGVPLNTARARLKLLLRQGVVRMRVEGSTHRYYPGEVDLPPEPVRQAPVLQGDRLQPHQRLRLKPAEQPAPPAAPAARQPPQVVWPAHVQVQRSAPLRDHRYEVLPGEPLTGGFLAEWHRLRAHKPARKGKPVP